MASFLLIWSGIIDTCNYQLRDCSLLMRSHWSFVFIFLFLVTHLHTRCTETLELSKWREICMSQRRLINRLTFCSVKFEFLNFFYFTFLSKSEFLFILSLLEKRWIENRWMDVWKKTCLLSSIPWNWNFILFSFTWNFYPLLFSSLFIWKQK